MDANGDSYERLGAICARYGLKLDHVDPEILGRMRLLAETTETVRDCERAAELAEEVFRHYDAFKPRERFSAQWSGRATLRHRSERSSTLTSTRMPHSAFGDSSCSGSIRT